MSQIPISQSNFVQTLLEAVPELQPMYDEHMDDNFDEFLGHVFFWDVIRFVSELLKKRNGPDSEKATEILIRIVNFCEEAMGSPDEQVRAVIALSFLDNINPKDRDAIYPFFGPKLQEVSSHYY